MTFPILQKYLLNFSAEGKGETAGGEGQESEIEEIRGAKGGKLNKTHAVYLVSTADFIYCIHTVSILMDPLF